MTDCLLWICHRYRGSTALKARPCHSRCRQVISLSVPALDAVRFSAIYFRLQYVGSSCCYRDLDRMSFWNQELTEQSTYITSAIPIRSETLLTTNPRASKRNFGAKTFQTMRCLLRIMAAQTQARSCIPRTKRYFMPNCRRAAENFSGDSLSLISIKGASWSSSALPEWTPFFSLCF